MVQPVDGATYGDALIFGLAFAEHHPWRFLLTVPLGAGIALVIMVLVLKIVVLGPIMQHKSFYEARRAKSKNTPKAKPSK